MAQLQCPFMALGLGRAARRCIPIAARRLQGAGRNIRSQVGDDEMKKILHVSCSPRGQAAESYRLSRKIIGLLLQNDPTATVINRVIGGGIAHIDTDYAISQSSSADVSRLGTMARSEELVHELESSDVVVIGTPMHNLTVPSVLKAWIDHIVRARRTFNITTAGKVGTLRDRPVFIAISSGGKFSGERARQPDFLTPYLTAILGIIGLHDLTFFSVQGTGAGPDAVAATRSRTDQALRTYFLSTFAVS
jgi:FMN-dependent NADH-azoreductase